LDLALVEFNLKKTLPFYEKKVYIPVDYHVHGKDAFEKFVKKHNLGAGEIPLLYGLEDVITTSEYCTEDAMIAEIYNIFKIVEV
jgi:hypothetical protein